MLNQVVPLRTMMLPCLIEYDIVNVAYHPWYQDIVHYLQHEPCPNHLENHE
jgi:hypothetical protein